MEDCIQFWGEDASILGARKAVLIAKINARLDHINGLNSQLFESGNAQRKNTDDEWKKLHRAATGDNMYDDDRKEDPNRLTAMLTIGWEMQRNVNHRREQLKRGWLSGG